MGKIYRIIFVSCIVILIISGCSCTDDKNSNRSERPGSDIIQIPLTGEIAERWAEISGLTCYKDQVIILPQYPDRFSTDDYKAAIFRIPKADIISFLDTSTPEALSPIKIEFDEQEIPDGLPGFQGYESVVIVGQKVYLTIEVNLSYRMETFLIEGFINDATDKIVLDESTLDSIPMPLQIKNFSHESMTYAEGNLYLFYEANGKNLTDSPQIVKVNLQDGTKSTLPFHNIEYRVTDATGVDGNGFFWVINYYWPGDYLVLNPADDDLASKTDSLTKFSRDKSVERLVEMNLSADGVKPANRNVILISSGEGEVSQNWEGIARLHNRGFILATDKHPKTILAFLPLNRED